MRRDLSKQLSVVILVLVLCASAKAVGQKNYDGLVVRGNVVNVELVKSSTQLGVMEGQIKVNLEFHNAGEQAVIFMLPSKYRDYWQGMNLARNEQDALSSKFFANYGVLESISTSDDYRVLAELLDSAEPPPDLTRVLQPGESWFYQTEVFAFFNEKPDRSSSHPNPVWDDVKSYASSLWMNVRLDVYPFNVENFKPDLARKLQRRWRRTGKFWVEKKEGRFNHIHFRSEPFPLDITQAIIDFELKSNKDEQ